MVRFDHWKLARRDRREVRRFRGYLQGMGAIAGACELGILHDDDLRCCRRERWDRTLAAVLAGLPVPAAVVAGLTTDPGDKGTP
jgi:hypothetical protein